MNDFLTERERQIETGISQHYSLLAPYPLEPDEAYMNVLQRQHFKDILLTWKENIQKKLTDLRQLLQADTMSEAATGDQALIASELNADIELQNYYQILVGKIDDAIHRINDMEYGFCENCDQAIGIRRLEALPLAVTCIVCQQLREKGHKR